MYIGENIKKLRKQKDISQEDLASFLGISFQAVSKWERNEGYPDITLLIPLANYFGVSVDELLGVSNAKNDKKIRDYLAQYDILGTQGEIKKKYDLAVEAYKEFPNDFRIIEKYMWQLVYDPNYENRNGLPYHIYELHKLCMRVLEDCNIDKIRYSALSILGGIYFYQGNIDKAIETAQRFPDFYQTEGEELENTFPHGSDERLVYMQKNIFNLCGLLTVKIRNSALEYQHSVDEKIKILKKAVTIFETIFDGDYGFYCHDLCDLSIWIGNRYIEKKEYKTAFDYIEKGLEFAKTYDELPEKSDFKCVLLNKIQNDMLDITSSSTANKVAVELKHLNGNFYDLVREMPEFKAIIEKHKPFAKDHK